MEKDYFRYYHPKRLLAIILFLSAVLVSPTNWLYSLINNYVLVTPYFQFPAVSSLIILILLFLNKKGLRIPIIKWLFWHKDISGRYEGKIEYKHFKTGEIEKKRCAVEIEQNASKIIVKSYFDFKDKKEKTTSKSLVASIVKDGFDNLSLIFTYHNSGNIVLGIQPSNGTNILKIKEVEGKIWLEGIYYTDRVPQTKGKMKVKFKSKKLKYQL